MASPLELKAAIICTTNQLEGESFVPLKSIVTLFRIVVHCGEHTWEIYRRALPSERESLPAAEWPCALASRRYSDFHDLNDKLCMIGAELPELPPKLLLNQPEFIAERYLELDRYLKKLLCIPHVGRHSMVLEFLGAGKQGVRYGVRRYEYDSSQSEGNRYIRDHDL